MNSVLDNTVLRIAEDTFAAMAYVLPAEEPCRAPCDKTCCESACIGFSGPFDGGLILTVPRSMLPILAANILGIPDPGEISAAEAVDVLTEMVNVICGNLLPVIAAPKHIFRLCQPRKIAEAEVAEVFRDCALRSRVSVQLECGAAELSLYTNQSSRVAVT
jgi:hypothetical protein